MAQDPAGNMTLKIFQPSNVFLEQSVSKVVAEGPAGSFGILPRHIDLATALVPGILSYETVSGKESFVALNGGVLVKQGTQVSIATRTAIEGELGKLKNEVDKMITDVDERERKARTAVARLEADLVRRMMEFGKNV
ncbi:F0F1 ATP synthase subunit epsilon [Thermodesulfobacteriota bacterium]